MSKSSRRKKQEPREMEEAAAAELSEAEQSEAEADQTSAEPEAESPDVPDPLELMRQERDAFQEKWLRLVAELDNLRKRTRRELIDSRRLAQADVLRPILGAMDNFKRALESLHGNKDHEDYEKFLVGVDLIFQNFQGVLKDLGAVPMEALDKEFDPAFHEAVGQLPREGVEPGLVIEVTQNGFMFQDQVLRPARVIISA